MNLIQIFLNIVCKLYLFYFRALKFLDDSSKNFSEPPEELQKMVDLRLKCYNNLAAAQLKASSVVIID